jgi:starch synthase (maltosyl-transferring)
MIDTPIVGKEEYYMSEKFQLCHYDWTVENNVTNIISKVNHIRKENTSLQQTNNIKFLETGNDQLIAFYKWDVNKSDETITVISLDAHHSQTGSVQLPMYDLGIHQGQKIEVKDLITNNSYNWYNEWNYIELHPNLPFHIFKINK